MRQFTKETINYINLFESLTKAKVRDCFLNKELTFIVEEGYIGKAIGKKGYNVFKMSRLTKKRIRVIEFNDDIILFIKNLISPVESKIYKENNTIFIQPSNSIDKGIIIGRERKNLKEINKILSNYFNVDVKVV